MSKHTPERILAELRRRSTLPKDVPERAYLIGIRWLLAEAADALESALNDVAEEPEWEYVVKTSIGYFGADPDGTQAATHRRRKAGPWLPVKQEGAES